MNTATEWPVVLRIVWIAGGLVAISEPENDGLVEVRVGLKGKVLRTFQIAKFAELFAALRGQGFRLIGCTFLTDIEEFQGLRPPHFRASNPGAGWLVWDVWQKWRQITHAAGKDNKMALMDVSARIAATLMYSEMRLYDLAAGYSSQLRAHTHDKAPKDYVAFKDGHSHSVYKAIHALFWEMAVLRDNLAEFVSVYCLSRSDITSLSGLLKSLRQTPSADPLAIEVQNAAQDGVGWLSRFTSYRNCFTHVSSMEHAAGVAFTIQDLQTLSDGTAMPHIYYPLPVDVEALMLKRRKGPLFGTLKELAEASARRHDRATEPDALDYLHATLHEFAKLADRVIQRSPIAPKPIALTKDDIRGEIRIKRG